MEGANSAADGRTVGLSGEWRMITPTMQRYGLDEQFDRFVIGTMVWTVIVGLLTMAASAVFENGQDGVAPLAVLYLLMGGAIAAPLGLLAYTLWFRPSTIVFGRIFRRLIGRYGERTAAMIAGTITALVGSIAFYVITTLIMQDFDGMHALIILFGLVSLLVAPVMAWRIYRDRGHQTLQGTK